MTLTRDHFIESFTDEHGEAPPTHWAICGACQGNGTMTLRHLSFSAEDFAADPDFAEDYFAGMYDEPCDECDGSGKVREFDGDAADEWAEWCAEAAADLAVRRAESGYSW